MNSLEFEIVHLITPKPEHKASVYSVRLKGEDLTEAEKFFEKFQSSKQNKIKTIVDKIYYMAEKRGCLDNYFDDKQSSIMDNVSCIPQEELRLYCLRFGKVAVILGGGDIKKVATYQESDELFEHVKLMKRISQMIDERIRNKEISVSDIGLSGNLNFQITENE